MTLSDSDVRYGFASMMRAPSVRTKQARIGASDLANLCDRCVGRSFAGLERPAMPIDPWWGAWVGSAIHDFSEKALHKALAVDLSPQEQHGAVVEAVATMFRGAQTEQHVHIHEFDGYGPVGGSFDILVPDADAPPAIGAAADDADILDLKNSTRLKSLILQDWLWMNDPANGGEPRWGVEGIKKRLSVTFEFEGELPESAKKDAPMVMKLIKGRMNTSLAQSKWEKDVADAGHKFMGYFGQQQLYLHSKDTPARHAKLVFLNRDGTGIFDDPAHERYDDPTAVHDLWVHGFDYDPAYAGWLIARGQSIYDFIDDGGSVGDLDAHENCFVCGLVQEDAALDAPIYLTPEDVPAELRGVAA